MLEMLVVVLLFTAVFFVLILLKNRKHEKRYWKEHDHTKAKIMLYRKSLPIKGFQTFVVNPHKWVIIDWDVSENRLDIWEPKHTYKTPDEYKLAKGSMNWKFVLKKEKVSAKDYFSRTRIR